ncbi:hypothetical protein H2201_005566 [Coniosporium apollinis]|uniref:Fungal-type protein kinase domain-containing protein n=1 Tax=Coniosporium apollinis TaxID=61459 RepID=A0ABQ9NW43_9PEZI|nr:hypothetical protein H2201_005566 [Coniosporium apollinis]
MTQESDEEITRPPNVLSHAEKVENLLDILTKSQVDDGQRTKQQESATGGPQATKNPQPDREVRDLLTDLNALLPDASPLRLLQHRAEAFFKHGTRMASFVFTELEKVAMEGVYELDDQQRVQIELSTTELKLESEYIEDYPWTSCKLAATLVMILAAPKEAMHDAIKSQSRSLGGMPKLQDIRKTPSASFIKEFRSARDAARGKEQSTTVMQVTLTDVCIFELEEQGQAEQYFEFSHVFVVGVGPEGVIVWQAWGKHGYRLDEYLGRNGARIRDWKEAEQFADDFEKLILGMGKWTARRNKLYKKLFEVDINQICGPEGPERPTTPKYEAWVRIHVLKNVKCEDVGKLHWV